MNSNNEFDRIKQSKIEPAKFTTESSIDRGSKKQNYRSGSSSREEDDNILINENEGRMQNRDASDNRYKQDERPEHNKRNIHYVIR
jgi:hypothetical protein